MLSLGTAVTTSAAPLPRLLGQIPDIDCQVAPATLSV